MEAPSLNSVRVSVNRIISIFSLFMGSYKQEGFVKEYLAWLDRFKFFCTNEYSDPIHALTRIVLLKQLYCFQSIVNFCVPLVGQSMEVINGLAVLREQLCSDFLMILNYAEFLCKKRLYPRIEKASIAYMCDLLRWRHLCIASPVLFLGLPRTQ
jgi:hypothetical protein